MLNADGRYSVPPVDMRTLGFVEVETKARVVDLTAFREKAVADVQKWRDTFNFLKEKNVPVESFFRGRRCNAVKVTVFADARKGLQFVWPWDKAGSGMDYQAISELAVQAYEVLDGDARDKYVAKQKASAQWVEKECTGCRYKHISQVMFFCRFHDKEGWRVAGAEIVA